MTNRKRKTGSANSSGVLRVVAYARVSTDEQTKGNYTSCTTQVEEMEAHCRTHGLQIVRTIKDEGHSAGTLKRPGLSEVRYLVENEHVDIVLCTWTDRFIRSRDFYVLDKEFETHGVKFQTLHDPTDSTTAAGRFTQSVFVAAKTYDREQTAEKVRVKMKQRAQKGMWNGGKVPFGFIQVDKERTIVPDPALIPIINEMFRVYNETGSDFKVRDYLHANQIKARDGRSRWQVSTLRKILTNRRYIAQIEINRENKGIEDLPEIEQYQIAAAPYEPIVPIEVFETAQYLREQNGFKSPNRVGRPRGYTQSQCERVYPLQGLVVCGYCGSALTPYYVRHKAGEDKSGKKRTKDCFIHYYVCSQQTKGWSACDHRNCVSARQVETWTVRMIENAATLPGLLEEAVEQAQSRLQSDFAPLYEAARLNAESLRKVTEQIETVLDTVSNGQAMGALWEMLNERAFRLKFEREQLLREERRLKEQLTLANTDMDALELRKILSNMSELIKNSPPEEVQQLLRLLLCRIEWAPKPREEGQRQGNHNVDFFYLGRKEPQPAHDERERAGVLSYGVLRYPVAPQLRTTVLRMKVTLIGEVVTELSSLRHLASSEYAVERVAE